MTLVLVATATWTYSNVVFLHAHGVIGDDELAKEMKL